jgi:hypothetical protein
MFGNYDEVPLVSICVAFVVAALAGSFLLGVFAAWMIGYALSFVYPGA